MKTVLITGFGSFPGVASNPTADMARALNGRHVGSVRFVGVVLPVSYRRAPQQTLAAIAAHKVSAVLGLGVAMRSTEARVESVGRWVPVSRVDIEGQTLTLLKGPGEVASTWNPQKLAAGLMVDVSEDAGNYVCNGWLYQVAAKASVPVAFLHVPETGFDTDRLAQALSAAV